MHIIASGTYSMLSSTATAEQQPARMPKRVLQRVRLRSGCCCAVGAGLCCLHIYNGNLKSNSVMRLATATVETSSDYC
jgi:hypothetical protein